MKQGLISLLVLFSFESFACLPYTEYGSVDYPEAVRIQFNSKHELFSLAPGSYQWMNKKHRLGLFSTKTLLPVYEENGNVLTATLSNEGDQFIWMDWEGNIHFYDINQASNIKVINSNQETTRKYPLTLEASPNGKYLVIPYKTLDKGPYDIGNSLSVVDTSSFKVIVSKDTGFNDIRDFYFNNNSKEFSIGGFRADKKDKIANLEIETLKELSSITLNNPVRSFSFDNTGNYMAVGYNNLAQLNSQLFLHKLISGKAELLGIHDYTYRNHDGFSYWVTATHFVENSNEKFLFTGNETGMLSLFAVKADQLQHISDVHFEEVRTASRFQYRILDIASSDDGENVGVVVNGFKTVFFKRNRDCKI